MTTSSILDLPVNQIEYTPSIDLSGKPEFSSNDQLSTLRSRLITWLVKYPSNFLGYVPLVGSIIGVIRIAFSLLYLGLSTIKFTFNTYQYGFFKARKVFLEEKEFSDEHYSRGIIELIPIYNTIYLIYYDFILSNFTSGRFNFY